MMTLSDETALMLVSRQGFGRPEEYGPDAPTTALQLLKILEDTRKRGYGMTHDMFGAGLASMAVPIRRGGDTAVGVVSVAGPSVRLPAERFRMLYPRVSEAAAELAAASVSSPLFMSRRLVANEGETGK
jgi:DNA-binding IclR family transcriptional regulator